MLDIVKFGQRLRQARHNAGLTIANVAQLVGRSEPTISKYEHGTVYPVIDRAYELAQLYGCSMDWLCGEDDEE